jgi:molybdopterin converting factor small subunit
LQFLQQHGEQILKIMVRAFGPIMDLIGRKREMDLPPGSTLDDLANMLEKNAGTKDGKALRILGSNLTVLVNGVNAEVVKSRVLKDGDNVDVLSPFVGG